MHLYQSAINVFNYFTDFGGIKFNTAFDGQSEVAFFRPDVENHKGRAKGLVDDGLHKGLVDGIAEPPGTVGQGEGADVWGHPGHVHPQSFHYGHAAVKELLERLSGLH